MRISDWSSDVCSSDLGIVRHPFRAAAPPRKAVEQPQDDHRVVRLRRRLGVHLVVEIERHLDVEVAHADVTGPARDDLEVLAVHLLGRFPELQEGVRVLVRSEEHTSELQSLMRISYAVFCWKNNSNANKHI